MSLLGACKEAQHTASHTQHVVGSFDSQKHASLMVVALPLILLGTLAALALGTALMFGRKKHDFKGKHVVITGGSTGIGLSLAEELVKRGAHVTLIARTRSKLEEAQAALQQLAQQLGTASRVEIAPADVTDYPQVRWPQLLTLLSPTATVERLFQLPISDPQHTS